MALTTFKVKSILMEGVVVENTAGKFKLTMDEPVSLGGTDTGMNPVEALLASLGSCQCIMARLIARKMNIGLKNFSVDLEGDLDPEGLMGNENVRPGYQKIRATFNIDSDASEADLDKFVRTIEKFCPVMDCLVNKVDLHVTKL